VVFVFDEVLVSIAATSGCDCVVAPVSVALLVVVGAGAAEFMLSALVLSCEHANRPPAATIAINAERRCFFMVVVLLCERMVLRTFGRQLRFYDWAVSTRVPV
jgi:hypothetical protein